MITDTSGKTPPSYDYPGQATPGYKKVIKNGNGGKAAPQPTAMPERGNGRPDSGKPRGDYTK